MHWSRDLIQPIERSSGTVLDLRSAILETFIKSRLQCKPNPN